MSDDLEKLGEGPVEAPGDLKANAAQSVREEVEALAEPTDAEQDLLANFGAESLEEFFELENGLETFLSMLPTYFEEGAISQDRLGHMLVVAADVGLENATFILESLDDPSFPLLGATVYESVRQICEAKLAEG